LSPEHAASVIIPAATIARMFLNSQTINQTFLCCKLFCVRIFRVDACNHTNCCSCRLD
jgi:hypothetical protein